MHFHTLRATTFLFVLSLGCLSEAPSDIQQDLDGKADGQPSEFFLDVALDMPILVGKQPITGDEFVAYLRYRHNNPTLRFPPPFDDKEVIDMQLGNVRVVARHIGELYEQIARYEGGVNIALALAQSALESNYFRSDMFQKSGNPAGIGATGENGKFTNFTDAQLFEETDKGPGAPTCQKVPKEPLGRGVLAHVQKLKGLAYVDPNLSELLTQSLTNFSFYWQALDRLRNAYNLPLCEPRIRGTTSTRRNHDGKAFTTVAELDIYATDPRYVAKLQKVLADILQWVDGYRAQSPQDFPLASVPHASRPIPNGNPVRGGWYLQIASFSSKPNVHVSDYHSGGHYVVFQREHPSYPWVLLEQFASEAELRADQGQHSGAFRFRP